MKREQLQRVSENEAVPQFRVFPVLQCVEVPSSSQQSFSFEGKYYEQIDTKETGKAVYFYVDKLDPLEEEKPRVIQRVAIELVPALDLSLPVIPGTSLQDQIVTSLQQTEYGRRLLQEGIGYTFLRYPFVSFRGATLISTIILREAHEHVQDASGVFPMQPLFHSQNR